MTGTPNSLRGEAAIEIAGEKRVLRPSFEALVAAEEEMGPLYALVERAAKGELRLSEVSGLFWHCLSDRTGLTREELGEQVLAQGLAQATKPMRILLAEILKGRG